jgi:hypothetical protein
MTNIHTQSTLTPLLPESALSSTDKLVLRTFGFEVTQSVKPNHLYLYAKDSLMDVELFDRATAPTYVSSQLDPWYPTKPTDSPGPNRSLSIVDVTVGWEGVLQHILNKPECVDIPYIAIEGAMTCDIMRQGEFGGWACVIKRDSIHYHSTKKWIAELVFDGFVDEASVNFVDAVEVVLTMAKHPTIHLTQPTSQQLEALAVVEDWLVNHPTNE